MARKTRTIKTLGLLCCIVSLLLPASVLAQTSEKVTMKVGEKKTLYLPSHITSKRLKSVTFYSNSISNVEVNSYTNYSVTVEAKKSFSSELIVRCDYTYYILSGGKYVYGGRGFYDFRVTVVDDGTSAVKPTKITFPSSAVGISVGESRQLTPAVQPANAEYILTWSINDKAVATISQDGLLVGKSVGAADLTVKADNGVYAMLRVVVSAPTASSVSVTPSSLTISEGESRYLSAKVYPSNASQSVSWSSNNPSVVSVSSSGKVTGYSVGTAIVTARTSNGKSGSCTVVCKEVIPNLIISDKEGVDDLPAKANVTYERTFHMGWNSACLPFAITQNMLNKFYEGGKIATIAELEVVGEERFLSIKEIQMADAGMPCFIYAPKDVMCTFSLANTALMSLPDTSSGLKGTYQRKVIGGGFYKLTDDGTSLGVTRTDEAIVAPFRAYILLDGAKASTSPMKIQLTQSTINN